MRALRTRGRTRGQTGLHTGPQRTHSTGRLPVPAILRRYTIPPSASSNHAQRIFDRGARWPIRQARAQTHETHTKHTHANKAT